MRSASSEDRDYGNRENSCQTAAARQTEGPASASSNSLTQNASGSLAAAWLLVFEARLPLRDKSRHAFLLVGRREKRVKKSPLEQQPLSQRRLVRPVDGFLRHHDRRDRQASDLRGNRDRLVE